MFQAFQFEANRKTVGRVQLISDALFPMAPSVCRSGEKSPVFWPDLFDHTKKAQILRVPGVIAPQGQLRSACDVREETYSDLGLSFGSKIIGLRCSI